MLVSIGICEGKFIRTQGKIFVFALWGEGGGGLVWHPGERGLCVLVPL